MSKPFAFPPEFLEEKFEESLVELGEFSDVQGIDEFTDLLINHRNNEKLIILSKLVDGNFYKKIDKSKNIEIIKNAKKEMDSLRIFKSSNVLFSMFACVYDIIAYSCISELGRELTSNEFNHVLNSDLIGKLTIAQENFLTVNNPNLDRNFFKSLNKVRITEKTKKLQKCIYKGYWKYITAEVGLDTFSDYSFAECTRYLAGCYAFADGRKEVTPEDLLRSWTLTLNLFNMDLRPYVFR